MNPAASNRLTGCVALVSGGLRGIGEAIAARFVAEGARVIVSDLDAQDSTQAQSAMAALGQEAGYVRADVTKEADWLALREHVEQRYGALHILVNNAGIDQTGAVETMSMEEWRRIMAVNIDGVFLACKTFTPMLAEAGHSRKGGSSIINMSSIMGLVGYPDISAYNASKGAVRLFTKGLAIEFAMKRMPIRVNSLHPGFVRTPLLEQGFTRMAALGIAGTVQELVDGASAQTPVGRLADAAEMAGPAFFLASEDSSYMTGAELVVDGGWTAQ
ncbi:glucose 1-dehydrogenase [Croceicoccus sp. F390]|uniref:Glucose 1-dehydrogenase n=1 Tax=Croceicoccus esteveae TaxID=3075597 RepID=A0ABU2ZHC0_9SPHN|nr:glucose 1-dehydrogenase [Croceicoccus sp. F390]MDT0575998.1 glucose 1-dehydrogenase [Croceicoccus sp. F390]